MERFKPATYAVMHLVVAIAVAYALTGSWTIALGVGIVEPIVQTGAYALHERVWERVSGRRREGRERPSPPGGYAGLASS